MVADERLSTPGGSNNRKVDAASSGDSQTFGLPELRGLDRDVCHKFSPIYARRGSYEFILVNIRNTQKEGQHSFLPRLFGVPDLRRKCENVRLVIKVECGTFEFIDH